MPQFKPNIMPIFYWALAYGSAAGILMSLMKIMAKYLTWAWLPVFLASLIWGGWRSWRQQRQQWYAQTNEKPPAQSVAEEIRQAASDMAQASQDMLNQDADEEPEPPAGR